MVNYLNSILIHYWTKYIFNLKVKEDNNHELLNRLLKLIIVKELTQ